MTEKRQSLKESFVEYIGRRQSEEAGRKAARDAKEARGERLTLADYLPPEDQRPRASDRLIVFELVKTDF